MEPGPAFLDSLLGALTGLFQLKLKVADQIKLQLADQVQLGQNVTLNLSFPLGESADHSILAVRTDAPLEPTQPDRDSSACYVLPPTRPPRPRPLPDENSRLPCRTGLHMILASRAWWDEEPLTSTQLTESLWIAPVTTARSKVAYPGRRDAHFRLRCGSASPPTLYFAAAGDSLPIGDAVSEMQIGKSTWRARSLPVQQAWRPPGRNDLVMSFESTLVDLAVLVEREKPGLRRWVLCVHRKDF